VTDIEAHITGTVWKIEDEVGDNVQEGDTVVIVAGSPPGIRGTTNALRVHHMGDAKNRVAPAYEDLALPS